MLYADYFPDDDWSAKMKYVYRVIYVLLLIAVLTVSFFISLVFGVFCNSQPVFRELLILTSFCSLPIILSIYSCFVVKKGILSLGTVKTASGILVYLMTIIPILIFCWGSVFSLDICFFVISMIVNALPQALYFFTAKKKYEVSFRDVLLHAGIFAGILLIMIVSMYFLSAT